MRYEANSSKPYDLYLKGRKTWKKRTEEGLKRSLEYFGRAIKEDPGFALGYSGLADAYTLLHVYHILPFEESYEKAKGAAEKALELDDSLAEAHASMGQVHKVFEGDTGKAEKEYKRAISLDPGYVTAHHWYSAILTSMGRPKDALEVVQDALKMDPGSTVLLTGEALLNAKLGRWVEAANGFQEAVKLDPENEMIRMNYSLLLIQMGEKERSLEQIEKAMKIAPTSLFTKGVFGTILYYTRQYDRAIETMKQALEEARTPSSMGRIILGQCYLQKEMYDEAMNEFQKAQEPSGSYTADTNLSHVAAILQGIIYARLGQKDKATEIMDEFVLSAEDYTSEPCWLGLLCLALSRRERGFRLLEIACESGDMWLRYIKVQPLFDRIRSDPRYVALLERMNLNR